MLMGPPISVLPPAVPATAPLVSKSFSWAKDKSSMTPPGGTPPASPTGSLNGMGYVRLDGTSSNSGKSDISYVNTSGIAAASALNDSSFSSSYRFFAQSNLTSREPGLNISVIGTDTHQYTFYSSSPSITPTVGARPASTTRPAYLVSTSAARGTLARILWQIGRHPPMDPPSSASGAKIWRVGFNIGSYQKNGLAYLDDFQTSLLNGGDTIDFQGPAAVPLPASEWTGSSFLALLVGGTLLRKRLRPSMA